MQKRLLAIGLALTMGAAACTDNNEEKTVDPTIEGNSNSGSSQFALSASTWELDHIVIGGEKLESDAPATILFTSDEDSFSVAGNAGCNTYTGAWALPEVEDDSEIDPEDSIDPETAIDPEAEAMDDDSEVNSDLATTTYIMEDEELDSDSAEDEILVNEVSITDISITEAECEDSTDFTEFIDFLPTVESWSVGIDGLTLLGADGNTAIAKAQVNEEIDPSDLAANSGPVEDDTENVETDSSDRNASEE